MFSFKYTGSWEGLTPGSAPGSSTALKSRCLNRASHSSANASMYFLFLRAIFFTSPVSLVDLASVRYWRRYPIAAAGVTGFCPVYLSGFLLISLCPRVKTVAGSRIEYMIFLLSLGGDTLICRMAGHCDPVHKNV